MLLSSWLKKPVADPEQLILVDTVPKELWRALEDGNVPPFHQALPQLAYEVARARRYERPFTIALFTANVAVDTAPKLNGHAHLNGHGAALADPTIARLWASSAVVTVVLSALLRESLREADIVTYAPRFALCVVGMPETHIDGARHAVARVQAICLERLLIPVEAGVAEFSKSGWTLEELIRQAEADAVQASLTEHPQHIDSST